MRECIWWINIGDHLWYHILHRHHLHLWYLRYITWYRKLLILHRDWDIHCSKLAIIRWSILLGSGVVEKIFVSKLRWFISKFILRRFLHLLRFWVVFSGRLLWIRAFPLFGVLFRLSFLRLWFFSRFVFFLFTVILAAFFLRLLFLCSVRSFASRVRTTVTLLLLLLIKCLFLLLFGQVHILLPAFSLTFYIIIYRTTFSYLAFFYR